MHHSPHRAFPTAAPGRFRTLVLLASHLLLAAIRLTAQEYDFKNLSVADGLPQSQVHAIRQDRRGNIWFGTRGGGAASYDGLSFAPFSPQSHHASDFIRAIIEDRSGSLWFGTDRGVVKYDGVRTTSFVDAGPIAGRPVGAIAQDSSGMMWFGMEGGGLARYDGQRWHAVPEAWVTPGGVVRALMADREGRVWAGSEKELVSMRGGEVRRYTAKDGLPAGEVTAIAQQKDGAIWIGTYGGGVARFDGAGFQRFTVADGLSNNTVLSLLADRAGNLWIGTAGGGAVRYDGAGFRVFTETEGLCNNVVASIAEDSDGDIWFGSSGGGVSRFAGEGIVRFTERQGKLGNWVYAILQDRNGRVWFGSSLGGVTAYDGLAYTRYAEAQGFTAVKVRAILEYPPGRLWFGTTGDGFYSYDGRAFLRPGGGDGMRGRFVNAITHERDGIFWLACSDVGLVRYDSRASDNASRFRYITRELGLPWMRVYDVEVSPGGVIWAATEGGGIERIMVPDSGPPTVTSFTMREGLSSNVIRGIVPDARGHLFFGTAGGGVIAYDGRSFRTIGKKEGISSDNIYALAVIDDTLWIGSDRGIDRVTVGPDCAVRSIRHYGAAEGVLGVEVAQNAAYADRGGNVWFGTIRGAVKLEQGGRAAKLAPPLTHITGVRLFFRTEELSRYAPAFTPWTSIPVSLALPHDRNHLSFDFIGISQRNPERVRYQWKLDGFDPGWSAMSPTRSAVYSNLPPGTYTFLVRAYNADGVGTRVPARFSFTIHPPFWETWWFRTLAGLAVALGIRGVFRARVAAIREESERERKELEMRRNIVELQQKSLRLSMNPHFIFNALTSIQSFIMGNNPPAAREHLGKFAKLMRGILENSRETWVPLDREMAMLRAYLDLERLNMNGRFDYAVDAGPELDPAAVAIPSMLVQPFVENGVIHGLRNREGIGRIEIRFTLDEGLIRCVVIDDGIGRDRAAAIGGLRSDGHLSSALAVAEERLAIMASELNIRARLAITDLYDEAGSPAGTRVDIFMPAEWG